MLLALADANAFVLPLDPERTWFRYHHLFGDLLRLELRRTLPEEVPDLHRRAAGWFIRQGRVVDAIRHTQAAGDWTDAARLLADYSFSLTLDGQAQTMQALVRAFPSGEDHPELALVRAGGDAGPRTPRRGGRPSGGRRDLRRDGAAGSPAPPPGGDRVAAAVAGPAARPPGRRARARQVPQFPAHRAVRRGHRARQRPARGGADEPGDGRGVDARAPRRRAPPPAGGRPGPGDRPALPRSRLPGRSSASRPRSSRSPPPSSAAGRR